MKNKIKSILTILTVSIIIAGTVVASGYTQTIEVMMNSIKIKINDEYMSGDNIVYKGTSYAPLRIAAETLGKDVDWDQKTNTATINDKVEDDPLIDFKVPTGVPEGAVLIENFPEYKCQKYKYNVKLPNGGYTTHATISNAPGEEPHSSIMGFDSRSEPFFVYIRASDRNDGIGYRALPNAHIDNKADIATLRREMNKFFDAYGY